jgi:RNA polymerase sigma-70 factor (ECF subfamily)
VSDSDQTLLMQSQQGSRAAFEELVRRTARLVFSRAYLETGDVHRAEDLAQEAYLNAWRSIGQVTDAKSLRPWLISIVHTAAIDAARRRNRKKRFGRQRESGEMLQLADSSPSPAESVERADERQRALSVLRDLPEEYRQVLMLRYLGGADYETISRQLALSNGSLRGLLHRGLQLLRTRLTDSERRS